MTTYLEVEHRITPLQAATWDRWVQFYVDTSIPLMTRNGFDVLGGWRRLTGPAAEDVVLASFDNLAGFQTAGDALMQDADLAVGLGQLHEDLPDLGVAEITKLGDAPRWAAELVANAVAADGPHDYVQVRSMTRDARQLFRRLREPRDDGFSLVTCYTTRSGARNEATSLWMCPQGDAAAALRAGAPFAGDLAYEERVDLLTPLPYSALQ